MAHVPSAGAGARPRVVVADDSSFMRRLLGQALRDGGFDVVGEAEDGDRALELFRSLRPDAMTLDLAMPGRDGIGVLKTLRADSRSLPIVVVSAFSPAHGARAVDALAEGAFDLVAKPEIGESFETFAQTLRDKLTAAAGAAPAVAEARTDARAGARRRATRTAVPTDRVTVIATSTGGPRALAAVLPELPRRIGSGGLIVQHMPEGFTESLAARLDRASSVKVREAAPGDRLDPSALLVAPGGKHLRLDEGGVLRLSDEAAIGALRPRADLTISDAARVFGSRVLLVVMTGMGADGLAGARDVRRAGGRVIVEHESTCTVYGMPRAVADAGLADAVLPLHELAEAIAA